MHYIYITFNNMLDNVSICYILLFMVLILYVKLYIAKCNYTDLVKKINSFSLTQI